MNMSDASKLCQTHNGSFNAIYMRGSRNGEERRIQNERREFSLRTLLKCTVSPRRFTGRRREDRRFPKLDCFESALGFLAVGLVILSIIDATFTLKLISLGGEEVNPFMLWMMNQSISAFVATKMLLTAVPAIVLVATANHTFFGIVRARSILAALVGLYIGLIVYEIGLLSIAMG